MKLAFRNKMQHNDITMPKTIIEYVKVNSPKPSQMQTSSSSTSSNAIQMLRLLTLKDIIVKLKH